MWGDVLYFSYLAIRAAELASFVCRSSSDISAYMHVICSDECTLHMHGLRIAP